MEYSLNLTTLFSYSNVEGREECSLLRAGVVVLLPMEHKLKVRHTPE